MSADGKIASPSGKQIRISSDEDIERMYCMRNDSDAVLVGIKTVLSDDPKLTVKKACVLEVKNPIRVVLDTHCKTPEESLVVNKDAKTFIITGKKCDKKFADNVEVIRCETNPEGLIDIPKMLDMLYNRGIRNLMVEGGSTVIWNFLKNKLVDDMFVYIGPMIIGGKDAPTLADGEGFKNNPIPLAIKDIQNIGPGILIHYRMIK
jgi:2,5-diamino-6-(ribosylamino)-4(3H)-pyrimidinone 5'-phosphate reductase